MSLALPQVLAAVEDIPEVYNSILTGRGNVVPAVTKFGAVNLAPVAIELHGWSRQRPLLLHWY